MTKEETIALDYILRDSALNFKKRLRKGFRALYVLY